MDFLKVIQSRHSVRKFTDQPVDREVLDAIVSMAQTAPSSKNVKSSAFMIIEDPDTLQAISEMRDSGSTFVRNAAAAIVVMGDSSKTDMWVENCSISATYVMLAATSMDLGSCWVQVSGRPRSKTDSSLGTADQYLHNLLGIKDEMKVECVIALGYENIVKSE